MAEGAAFPRSRPRNQGPQSAVPAKLGSVLGFCGPLELRGRSGCPRQTRPPKARAVLLDQVR